MGLPKGYKKTWNSGGGRPALTFEQKKKSVNVYLTQTEKACLDAIRGEMSISNFIKRKLGLNSKSNSVNEMSTSL